ncbi:hypothetical protein SEA_ARCHIE_1 [Mycobacterium phage Archie]|uniref:Uncharacterized protein n=1 Tax=Mycobacterium phage Archie TaxID=1718599 RepID=A0A0M4RQG2_9CAUD|nr:hypothetical protein AVU85_gp001 [Mycobacterium phage Archie]ALF00307.1 hypothetical protein SEA_ARCHIE_1 [Mycobacterium phage Archie]
MGKRGGDNNPTGKRGRDSRKATREAFEERKAERVPDGWSPDFWRLMRDASRSQSTSEDEAIMEFLARMDKSGRSSWERATIQEARDYTMREEANVIAEEMGRKYRELTDR